MRFFSIGRGEFSPARILDVVLLSRVPLIQGSVYCFQMIDCSTFIALYFLGEACLKQNQKMRFSPLTRGSWREGSPTLHRVGFCTVPYYTVLLIPRVPKLNFLDGSRQPDWGRGSAQVCHFTFRRVPREWSPFDVTEHRRKQNASKMWHMGSFFQNQRRASRDRNQEHLFMTCHLHTGLWELPFLCVCTSTTGASEEILRNSADTFLEGVISKLLVSQSLNKISQKCHGFMKVEFSD